jgi:hypothetical protein
MKLSKKNLNIWVESADGRIKMIKIPIKYKLEFIQKFGTEKLAKEMDVAEWIINKKDGYYI